MASKLGEDGQIWLKCITGDLIMMIRYKNNIFERVKKNHAEMAWNYPPGKSHASLPLSLETSAALHYAQ